MRIVTILLSLAFATWAAPLCESALTQLEATHRLDSATSIRYTPGVYATEMGTSSKSTVDAQRAARMRLVEKLNSRIQQVMEVIDQKQGSKSKTTTKVTSSFDQSPLLRSDADLVCKGDKLYFAEAHLKMADYIAPLRRQYEDSAKVFRTALAQATKAREAKDEAREQTNWTRASRLYDYILTQGRYLLALLAESSRGESYDIAAVLDASPFPEFTGDLALWDKAVSEKESKVNALTFRLHKISGSNAVLPVLTSALANMGLTVDTATDAYELRIQGIESGYEGSFGGVYRCDVEIKAELRNSQNKVLGVRTLRDKTWKISTVGDSTEVCEEVWSGMESSILERELKPLLKAYIPVQ